MKSSEILLQMYQRAHRTGTAHFLLGKFRSISRAILFSRKQQTKPRYTLVASIPLSQSRAPKLAIPRRCAKLLVSHFRCPLSVVLKEWRSWLMSKQRNLSSWCSCEPSCCIANWYFQKRNVLQQWVYSLANPVPRLDTTKKSQDQATLQTLINWYTINWLHRSPFETMSV